MQCKYECTPCDRVLPFLLQSAEVFFEGRTDLAQQLYQRVTQEAWIGWLGVECVGGRSAIQNTEYYKQSHNGIIAANPGIVCKKNKDKEDKALQ